MSFGWRRRPATPRACRRSSSAPAGFSITSRSPGSPARARQIPPRSPPPLPGCAGSPALPVAVGFGIKNPAQAAAVARAADAAVVGSSLVQRLALNLDFRQYRQARPRRRRPRRCACAGRGRARRAAETLMRRIGSSSIWLPADNCPVYEGRGRRLAQLGYLIAGGASGDIDLFGELVRHRVGE